VARGLLDAGAAYRCFATQDEIAAFREAARAGGRSTDFASPWRDADPACLPDAPFVIRLKAPRHGETVIDDAVQGRVTWRNTTLDDMVLLRSDGTPTYMLAVVVDDHDMGVTHVIRGDDHLANAARQALLYDALGWARPVFAHIPLIHGPDGRKLSKRHGALGVGEYRRLGYLPEAMRNYLARLGWGHGDAEVFSTEQAIDWFDLPGITRAPARFDLKKLDHVSGRHIAMADAATLLAAIADWRAATGAEPLDRATLTRLEAALPILRERAKTIPELLDKASFLLAQRPIQPDPGAALVLDSEARAALQDLTPQLQKARWERDALEAAVTDFASRRGIKLGQIAQPVRAALAGRLATPSIFDMMLHLGPQESLARIADAAA